MRPEDDRAGWRSRVEDAVRVEGVEPGEATRLARRFAEVYIEHGGRRCLDDRTPLIELRQQDHGLLELTFENQFWSVESDGPEDRAEAVGSMAREAARESTLWW